VCLNTKKGNKLKATKLFTKVAHYINSYFIDFNKELMQTYPAYNIFWEFSRSFDKEFYSLDFLFRYIYLNVELIFLIKRLKPASKKKKKKKKISNKMIISYLPTLSRQSITTRLISAYINSSLTKSSIERLGGAIMYLIFTGKNSFLYKKKIAMYQRILDKKKFY